MHHVTRRLPICCVLTCALLATNPTAEVAGHFIEPIGPIGPIQTIQAIQPHQLDALPRALATQFADGRTTYLLLKPSGSASWTGLFPRVVGVDTDRDDLPLAALDVAVVMKGLDATVGVSLIYGRPHQRTMSVAKVTVTQEAPVRIDQLTLYGVEPITLSIVPVPMEWPDVPTISTPSSSLEASIEMMPGATPGYRIVVVNQSAQALRGFKFVANRDGRLALSGYRRAPRHEALIEPGSAFVFQMSATLAPGPDGTVTIRPLDRMTLTSVTWNDGTVEGDPEPAIVEQVLAAGSAQQLARVLSLFSEAGDSVHPMGLPELRGRLDALTVAVSPDEATDIQALLPSARAMTIEHVTSVAQQGMQQVKQLILEDVDAFALNPSREAPGVWLSTMIADYESWLARAERQGLQKSFPGPEVGGPGLQTRPVQLEAVRATRYDLSRSGR